MVSLLVVVALSIWLTAWLVMRQVEATLIRHGYTQLEADVRLAKELIRLRGGDGPLRLADNKLVAPNGYVLDDASGPIDRLRTITGGFAAVLHGDGLDDANPRQPGVPCSLGNQRIDAPVCDIVLRQGHGYRGETERLGRRYLTVYEPLLDAAGIPIGMLQVGTGKADERSAATRVGTFAAAMGLALCLLGSGLLLLAIRRKQQPLQELHRALTELANGDLHIAVPSLGQADAAGRIADALQALKEGLIETRHVETYAHAEHARAIKRQIVMDQRTTNFAASIAEVMKSLGSTAEGTRESARITAQVASTVQEQADGTTARAAEASRKLHDVSGAVEEMIASVEEIARQVTSATQVANQAVKEADSGRASIAGLADATSQIGRVAELISSIAGQTNLLALNATIEAARAGEAGKGFTVVAGEVKTLAKQTSRATEEIGKQITAIQAASATVMSAMTQIAAIISMMQQGSAAIAMAVGQQSTTTRAIAGSIQVMNASFESDLQAMRQMARSADQAGETSQSVLLSACDIGAQAATLNTEVTQFLDALHDESTERRTNGRQPVRGLVATVVVPGQAPFAAAMRDISRNSVGLLCPQALSPRTKVAVTLPGEASPLLGRVARSDGQILGIVFQHDPATLQRVEKLFHALPLASAA